MNRRLLLRVVAGLGAAAVAGQLAGYTWLSSQDFAGTSTRWWTTALDEGRFRVRRPNTWRASVVSREPEFRIVLKAPGRLRVEIAGSSALMPLAAPAEATEPGGPSPLRKLHNALAARAAIGIANYAEEPPERSGALTAESLVSSFSGDVSGEHVRGFRYTMPGSTRVWTIVAVSPEAHWRRALPVMKRIAASVEVP